jgi:hypothetical protein
MIIYAPLIVPQIVADPLSNAEKQIEQASQYMHRVGHSFLLWITDHPGEAITVLSTAVIAWFSIVLARSTVRLWKTTRNAAAEHASEIKESIAAVSEANKISLSYLHAIQRPWITEESSPGSDLKWGPAGAEITINTRIKNLGISPARDISIDVRIYAMTPEHLPDDEMSKIIRKTENAPRVGLMLFPGCDWAENITVTLTRANIDRFLDQFRTGTKRPYVVANVLVYIWYRSVLSDQSHRTIRIYGLKRLLEQADHALQIDEDTEISKLRMSNLFLPTYAD